MYRVTEYIRDYPLEGQKYWSDEFHLFIRAYTVAKEIWEESVKTTKVLDPDYYVLIESVITYGKDEAEYEPYGAFNISGSINEYIRKRDITKFLSRFEDV